jgi:hypothetical protein
VLPATRAAGDWKKTENELLAALGATPVDFTADYRHANLYGSEEVASGKPSVGAILDRLEEYRPPPANFEMSTMAGEWALAYSSDLPASVSDEVMRQVDHPLTDLSVVLRISDAGIVETEGRFESGGETKSVTLTDTLDQQEASSPRFMKEQEGSSMEVSYLSKNMMIWKTSVADIVMGAPPGGGGQKKVKRGQNKGKIGSRKIGRRVHVDGKPQKPHRARLGRRIGRTVGRPRGKPLRDDNTGGDRRLSAVKTEVWTRIDSSSMPLPFLGRESLWRFGFDTEMPGAKLVPEDSLSAPLGYLMGLSSLAIVGFAMGMARTRWWRSTLPDDQTRGGLARAGVGSIEPLRGPWSSAEAVR